MTEYEKSKSLFLNTTVDKQLGTELELAKLAYPDTAQGITVAKQTTWAIVRWTLGLIFGVLTLRVLNIGVAPDPVFPVFVGVIALVGLLALWFVHWDLRRLRANLRRLRHKMGGLYWQLYPDCAPRKENEEKDEDVWKTKLGEETLVQWFIRGIQGLSIITTASAVVYLLYLFQQEHVASPEQTIVIDLAANGRGTTLRIVDL